MRPELRVVVEPGAERDRRWSRRNDGLREIAGIVAMHPDRVGERSERRGVEFARATLPLVLVLNAAGQGRARRSMPVEQCARRRPSHVITTPEAVLAWCVRLVIVEPPRLFHSSCNTHIEMLSQHPPGTQTEQRPPL